MVEQYTSSGLRVLGVDVPRQVRNYAQGQAIANTTNIVGSMMNAGYASQQRGFEAQREAARNAGQANAQRALANGVRPAPRTSNNVPTQRSTSTRFVPSAFDEARMQQQAQRQQAQPTPTVVREQAQLRATQPDSTASDMEYALATEAINALRLQGRSELTEGGGYSKYQNDVRRILSRFPNLGGDQVRQLLNDAYGVADEVQREQIRTAREETEKTQGFLREANLQRTRISLQGLNSRLQYATTPAERDEILGQIQTSINSVMADKSLSNLDRAHMLSGILEDVRESGEESSDLIVMVEGYQRYAAEAEQVWQRFRQGDMSAVEYDYTIGVLAERYQVPGDIRDGFSDPYLNERRANESMSITNDAHRLARQGLINQLDALELSRDEVGQLAQGLVTPADIARFEASPEGQTVWGQEVVEVARMIQEGQERAPQMRSRLASLRSQEAMLQAGTLSGLRNMARSGQLGDDLMSQIAMLRPDLAQALTSNQQWTPEQEAQFQQEWQAYRGIALRSIRERINEVESEYTTMRGRLDTYIGVETQANAQAVRETLPDRRAQQQAARRGSTPNF